MHTPGISQNGSLSYLCTHWISVSKYQKVLYYRGILEKGSGDVISAVYTIYNIHLSIPLHTNSSDDISCTIFVNFPVYGTLRVNFVDALHTDTLFKLYLDGHNTIDTSPLYELIFDSLIYIAWNRLVSIIYDVSVPPPGST